MKKIICILEESNIENPVVLTHQKTSGWQSISSGESSQYLIDSNKVVYLGRCSQDGDMFAVYYCGLILIFKGYINSGMY